MCLNREGYICLDSNAFRWITQGYTHVFLHEMGHAIVCKLITGENSEVTVYKNSCRGVNLNCLTQPGLSDWEKTAVCIAGPMADITFSISKLIVAKALKNYLSWPVAIALGGGAIIWISGEMLYAYVSASKKDSGDFGLIARHGNTHLALASATLISQCALAILALVKL